MIDLQKLKPLMKMAFGYLSIEEKTMVLASVPELIAEVERLDFLHKQDHSLADQWEARNQSLEAKLKLAEEALEKILLRKDECCGGLECACHDDAKDALAQLEEKP